MLLAAAACEMHPTAVLKGVTLRSVDRALEAANERARSARVTALPAIEVAGTVYAGEAGLEPAARALSGAR